MTAFDAIFLVHNMLFGIYNRSRFCTLHSQSVHHRNACVIYTVRFIVIFSTFVLKDALFCVMHWILIYLIILLMNFVVFVFVHEKSYQECISRNIFMHASVSDSKLHIRCVSVYLLFSVAEDMVYLDVYLLQVLWPKYGLQTSYNFF